MVLGKQAMSDKASKPAEYKAWKSKNIERRFIINQSVSNDVFIQLMQCKTSNEMLQSVYESRAFILLNGWENYVKSPADSMAQHITKVLNMVAHLNICGESISDRKILVKILSSLLEEFGSWKITRIGK